MRYVMPFVVFIYLTNQNAVCFEEDGCYERQIKNLIENLQVENRAIKEELYDENSSVSSKIFIGLITLLVFISKVTPLMLSYKTYGDVSFERYLPPPLPVQMIQLHRFHMLPSWCDQPIVL